MNKRTTQKERYGFVHLRNKIIKNLHEWEQLGCRVYSGAALFRDRRAGDPRFRHFWRLVFGVAKDGRAILVYPMPDRKGRIPDHIVDLLAEYHDRGALAGCAADIGDAWDIVVSDPKEYPRKSRTFMFQWESVKKAKRKNHGQDEEE